MNTCVGSVTFVLGLMMSYGSMLMGNVFYTENKLNPGPAPEVHPIHKERKSFGYYGGEVVAPLTYYENNEVGETEVLLTETVDYDENLNDGSETENVQNPSIITTDIEGGASAEKNPDTEKDGTNIIIVGKKKVSKNLAIGTIAGVLIALVALAIPVGLIILIVKKRKNVVRAAA